MSAQDGAALALLYRPQGPRQSGDSITLLYGGSVEPLRKRIGTTFGLPWGASAKRDVPQRAPFAVTQRHDTAGRAPWGQSSPVQSAHRAPWVITDRQDRENRALWVQYARRAALAVTTPWGVSAKQDGQTDAPWGAYARHAQAAPAMFWVVSRVQDQQAAAPWGAYTRRPAHDQQHTWLKAKPADAERFYPWVRFSRQLAPGWGVVVPSGEVPVDENGTVIVPIRSKYVTVNTSVLVRMDNGHIIPVTDMTMTLDTDSWTWGFSATVPGSALADVMPNSNGDPVIAQAAVNGTALRFALGPISRDRTFNSSQLRVGGRGIGAELDTPYAPQMSFGNVGARTAQQLLGDILTFNGVPIGWGVGLWQPTDWLIPSGVFSHTGTYISAINAVVGAAGAYIQPHNTDRTLDVRLRYPTPAWLWSTVTPDFELPAAVTSQEGFEWVDKPAYNRVYVTGQEHGINGRYTRSGTAGDYVAPSVVDPLITHADAARQRGRAIISDTGRIATVTLRMPVLAETGIIKPGNFVHYTEGGNTHIGITRAVSVAVNMPTIYQTLTVETHVEPI